MNLEFGQVRVQLIQINKIRNFILINFHSLLIDITYENCLQLTLSQYSKKEKKGNVN